MLDTKPLTSQATAATSTDHLGGLVARTAAGDRSAFRCLYAFLAVPVWRVAVRGLANPADAVAVTRSSFVELWHLARHHRGHVHTDLRAWLMAITAGRIDDRARIVASLGVSVADYDAHVHRELRDLLGSGRAVVRVGPRIFIRIDDLDQALPAISADLSRRRPADRYSRRDGATLAALM
jgi:hypothetical protein